MAKLSKPRAGKKTATNGSAAKAKQTKKAQVVDLDKESESEESEHDSENDNHHQEEEHTNGNGFHKNGASNGVEHKSNLLNDCKKAFNSTNLYEIFGLDKATATINEIKKSYYKMSLKYHPDKVSEEAKEEGTFKFQILGKIYSILSDEDKKKLYDECGSIDGEDELFAGVKDWDVYFRSIFKKISKSDIEKFYEEYRDSQEEKEDLLRLYEEHKGDMDQIMDAVFSNDLVADEPRMKQIILDAIENNEATKYDAFVKENKRKANKRKANYEKEAKEAQELKKELGIDDTQESLRNAILGKRKVESENFLDQLEAKYSKKNGQAAAKNGKKNAAKYEESDESDQIEEDDNDSDEDYGKPKKRVSNKKKAAPRTNGRAAAKNGKKNGKHVESEESEQDEIDHQDKSDHDDHHDDDDDDDDESQDEKPKKRTSIKKKISPQSNGNGKATKIQKKVKRL